MSRRVARLGAVGYLNARPLVDGLDRLPQFDVRFDVPAVCASLLHEGQIDVGLVPSIEYGQGPYCIVPDLAIASRGAVKSVALFTTKPMRDVRSIAMDTSSRTSVALVKVLCARLFQIQPDIHRLPPDLGTMLTEHDAALIIGDNALFLDVGAWPQHVEKVDLGLAWTELTGLPFVWAFWAGREDALEAQDVAALQAARNRGIERPEELAREYYRDRPERHAVGGAYLRDTIKYSLGLDECEGLERFYRYAAETGATGSVREIRFFGGEA